MTLTFGKSLDQFKCETATEYQKREVIVSREEKELAKQEIETEEANETNELAESRAEKVMETVTARTETTTATMVSGPFKRGRQITRAVKQTVQTVQTKKRKLVYTGGSDQPLKPLLRLGLRCVFIGFNPGTMSAIRGHYYAHPTNLFWRLIYESGCVDEPVTCDDDQSCVERFNIGFTDLIKRTTPGIGDLSSKEMNNSVPDLEERIASVSPRYICLVGKGIWDAIARVKKFESVKQKNGAFQYGLQNQIFGNAEVFVVPSTSGLAAGISRQEKLRMWKELSALIARPKKEDSL